MESGDRSVRLRRYVIRSVAALNTWVYRRSRGKWMGRFPGGAPVCLLTTHGRKSGQNRTVPLLYLEDGADWVLVASQGGAPQHPGWYLNLQADPHAELEIGAERFPVQALRVSEEEKAKLWPRLLAMYPPYATYQRRTTRSIPVVRLTRT
jgi:deazaflavin-dependent oxidoreductase (nitroreductase family)